MFEIVLKGILKGNTNKQMKVNIIKITFTFCQEKQTIAIIISCKNRVIASGFGQNMTRHKKDLKLSRTIWNKLFLCLLQNINGLVSFYFQESRHEITWK